MNSVDITSREQLITYIAEGRSVKYLFFWGHQKPDDGSINHGCLSQWYDSGFELDGIYYPTAEHYMMAEKARLFNDTEILEQIISSSHPNAAKKLGRAVTGYNDSVWHQQRSAIVLRGNIAKFSQNHALKDYLLKTQDRVLVEASPRDRIWGIGMGKSNPDAGNPAKWRGLNLLGFALMQARAHIASNE